MAYIDTKIKADVSVSKAYYCWKAKLKNEWFFVKYNKKMFIIYFDVYIINKFHKYILYYEIKF